MIRHLHVRNLAVVEEASVELDRGLVVLTGETGAGKSLVVDSLSLLGGARASAELVRSGCDGLSVSGTFELSGERWVRCREVLEAAGVACEEELLVVRREVAREGPNRVFVNDQPVTLRLLSQIAPLLLRIHGQRDELGLLSAEQQRQWVDGEGGARGQELVAAVASAYDRCAELRRRLRRATADDRSRHERIDLLRFQRSEIDAAKPVEDEEVELRAERERLRHAEEIAAAASEAVAVLSEDDAAAAPLLARAAHALERLAAWESGGEEWLRELEELRVRVEDLAATVRSTVGTVEADPRRLEEVEDRLALLERLLRKYGGDTRSLLAYRARIEQELSELDADDEQRERLEEEVAAALEEYRSAAAKLSAQRRRWARALAERVQAQLEELAMARARFAIVVEPRAAGGESGEDGEEGLWRDGTDQISFELAANAGEELRPLSRVASGGELARVYLALQVAAARSAEDAETLVFDEVDTGLGGAQAAVVGRKLKQLGAERQVLAVTHLPQVAALGDRHCSVRKETRRGRTRVAVVELEDDERVEEIARMLAAERVGDSSLSHARALLAEAGAVPAARS